MVQSVVSGLLAGGAYALIGVCIVLVFRMVRVVNFAQAATGAMGAYVAILLFGSGWSYMPAGLAGMVAGVAIGWLCGLVMSQWFSESSTVARSTVAIAMLIALLTLGFRFFGTTARKIPEIRPGSTVNVLGVNVGVSTIITVVGAIVLAFLISLFLDRTTLGIRMRALSERPHAAELLGVPAKRLAVFVWAFAGAISTAGMLLIAPSRQSDFASLGLIVLPSIAAASLGLFRSLGLAVLGGLLIGMIEGGVQNFSSIAPYSDAVPLVFIAVVLMWSQRGEVWDASR